MLQLSSGLALLVPFTGSDRHSCAGQTPHMRIPTAGVLGDRGVADFSAINEAA